jgi:hypothetical protein
LEPGPTTVFRHRGSFTPRCSALGLRCCVQTGCLQRLPPRMAIVLVLVTLQRSFCWRSAMKENQLSEQVPRLRNLVSDRDLFGYLRQDALNMIALSIVALSWLGAFILYDPVDRQILVTWLPVVGVIWLGCSLLNWLSSRYLHLTLQWAWTNHLRSLEKAGEAQHHRAEVAPAPGRGHR